MIPEIKKTDTDPSSIHVSIDLYIQPVLELETQRL